MAHKKLNTVFGADTSKVDTVPSANIAAINTVPWDSAASGAPVLTYITTVNETTDQNPQTFSSVNIGTAAADRIVIVAGISISAGSAGQTLSSATIGGSAATVHVTVQDGSSGQRRVGVGICSLMVASGTTADISLTWAQTSEGCQIVVYTLTGAKSTIYSSATAIRGVQDDVSINVVANGAVVACSSCKDLNGYTLTGVTEDFDAVVEAGVFRGASGSASSVAAATPRTIQFNIGSAAHMATAAVSWEPA